MTQGSLGLYLSLAYLVSEPFCLTPYGSLGIISAHWPWLGKGWDEIQGSETVRTLCSLSYYIDREAKGKAEPAICYDAPGAWASSILVTWSQRRGKPTGDHEGASRTCFDVWEHIRSSILWLVHTGVGGGSCYAFLLPGTQQTKVSTTWRREEHQPGLCQPRVILALGR